MAWNIVDLQPSVVAEIYLLGKTTLSGLVRQTVPEVSKNDFS